MKKGSIIKILLLSVFGLLFLGYEMNVFADTAATGGIGTIATNVRSQLGGVARLITAAAYLAGMAFAVAAIVKFKAHKDNPTQVPVSQGVVLLFVAGALMWAPAVFKAAGITAFATTTDVGSLSGANTWTTT